MCRKSHQATHILFKYFVSKVGGGGVKAFADNADVGGGGRSKIWENLH